MKTEYTERKQNIQKKQNIHIYYILTHFPSGSIGPLANNVWSCYSRWEHKASPSHGIQLFSCSPWWTTRFALIPTRLICDQMWDAWRHFNAAIRLWRVWQWGRGSCRWWWRRLWGTTETNDIHLSVSRHGCGELDGDKLYEYWCCLFCVTPPLTPLPIRQENLSPRLLHTTEP